MSYSAWRSQRAASFSGLFIKHYCFFLYPLDQWIILPRGHLRELLWRADQHIQGIIWADVFKHGCQPI